MLVPGMAVSYIRQHRDHGRQSGGLNKNYVYYDVTCNGSPKATIAVPATELPPRGVHDKALSCKRRDGDVSR